MTPDYVGHPLAEEFLCQKSKNYKRKRDQEIILMEELTGSKLLAQEGRAMRHCVASYVHKCVSGSTSLAQSAERLIVTQEIRVRIPKTTIGS